MFRTYKYEREVKNMIPTAVFTLGKMVTPYKMKDKINA